MYLQTLSQAQLKDALTYAAATGVFTWNCRVGNRAKGSRAGALRPDGYRVIGIAGTSYRAHRLAWLYMTGAWPVHEVDHINGVPGDDRFENLRDVPALVNQHNQRLVRVNNAFCYPGVYMHADYAKYCARITINYKQKHLGIFATKEEAYAAYLTEKAKHVPDGRAMRLLEEARRMVAATG